jgi:hypothetical protein
MTRTRIGIVIATVAGLAGSAAAQGAQPSQPPVPGPAPAEQPVEEPPPDPSTVEGTDPTGTDTTDPSATLEATGEPATPEEPATDATFGYDKGFYIEADTKDGFFSLKITSRVQVGMNVASTVDATDERNTNASFQISRARLSLDGHFFTKKIGYKFQTDFGRGFVALRDFYIDGEISDDTFVRAGQWKRPFSRQQINSSGRLELISRAITDGAFRNGRDIGVAVHNNYEKSPDLEWAIGVFNGVGQADRPVFSGEVDPDTGEVTGSFSNVPSKLAPAVVARVGVNGGGIKGYSEADLEGGPLRYAAAVSVWGEGDYDDDGIMTQSAQADVLIKNEGLSATAAVYFALIQGDDDADDSNLFGAHVQVGKVLGEGTSRMQPAARYAIVKAKDGDPTHEMTVGFGFWPYGHNFKILINAGARKVGDAGIGDNLFGQVELAAGFF